MPKATVVSENSPSDQTRSEAYGPLLNYLVKTIQEMLESGEVIIQDGVITLPDEVYVLSVEAVNSERI